MIPNLTEATGRLREPDLVPIVLLILAKAERSNHGPITTAQLKVAVKTSFTLSEEDTAPLKNRNDTSIDQIIRNLVSHRTLERNGYAEYKDGKFHITDAGKRTVLENFLDMIPMPSTEVIRKARAKASAEASTVNEADELAAAAEAPATPSRRVAP